MDQAPRTRSTFERLLYEWRFVDIVVISRDPRATEAVEARRT